MKAHVSDNTPHLDLTSFLQSILLINTQNPMIEKFKEIENNKSLSPMERQLENSKLVEGYCLGRAR